MSNIDQYTLRGLDIEKTRLLGGSLAHSLYKKPCTIDLIGELGAGKTTFVQALAKELRVPSPVTSPTFALEERHGEELCHIDLCRLSKKDATAFLQHSDDFPGIRVIEWADRSSGHEADISIQITDDGVDHRTIQVTCADIAIPSDEEIECFWKEAGLPLHIRNHVQTVAEVVMKCTEALHARGIAVRPKAIRAAALLHDLLRYVDFRTLDGDSYFTPDDETKNTWKTMKETYGTPHEPAAARYVAEKGFPLIGKILETHRGKKRPGIELPTTIEQKVLTYADKRVDLDQIVSLDTRFAELINRHQKDADNPEEMQWQHDMRALEKELFPDGVPF